MIGFNDLRKGEISANKDKLSLVTLNMRHEILLCGWNKNWNKSSAYRYGTIIKRQKALKK